MKNSMRRAMISTVCMLIVAVMSLTGVTYAWFSSAEQASIQQISVDVTDAAGGVEISSDLKNWGSKLDGPNITNMSFKPVSTTNKLSSNAFAFYGATFGESTDTIKTFAAANATPEALTANTNGWVQFTVYFRNTANNAINIDLYGTTLTVPTGEGVNQDILKAIRVGMVDFGDVSIEENTTVTDALFTQSVTDGVIYEPYHTAHTANGVKDGAVQGQKHTYYGVCGVTNDPVNRKTASEGVLAEVTTVNDWTNLKVEVAANSYAKVVFYVWIEGQDADCQNDVADTTFMLDMKLTSLTSSARNESAGS